MSLPLYPISICRTIDMDVLASRTLLLLISKGFLLPQYNAHLNHHSCLHRTGELRRPDDLVISRMYHHILTLLHQMMTGTVFAERADDDMKILTYRIYVR